MADSGSSGTASMFKPIGAVADAAGARREDGSGGAASGVGVTAVVGGLEREGSVTAVAGASGGAGPSTAGVGGAGDASEGGHAWGSGDPSTREAGGGPASGGGFMEGDVMAIPSLCMACEEQGITRLLLTRIPFFRDIILMAFECEHCGYRSSEVQPAEMQEKGCHFEVTVKGSEDLNRQLVKSDRATVRIPELDLEIPPITQKGVFTTIEGVLSRAVDNLSSEQTVRRAIDPDLADKVDAFLTRLTDCRDGKTIPFTLILDDPSGNSFVENPNAPRHDPNMKVRYYHRTKEQNDELGLHADAARRGIADEEGGASGSSVGLTAGAEDIDSGLMVGSAATTVYPAPGDVPGMGRMVDGKWVKGGALIRNPTERSAATDVARASAGAVRGADGSLQGLVFDSSASDMTKEVMRLPVDCSRCGTRGECNMCVTDVPHFKEVIIMAFTCEQCGFREVEVKGGGAVPPTGTVTTLRYNPDDADAASDLTRDVIKGDTSNVEIPELELVVEHGSLGGMYTTVEGLLEAVKSKLGDSDPFVMDSTDSGDSERRAAFLNFMERLQQVREGRVPFTLILRDPMANTWVYSPCAPAPDPKLTHEQYVRSTAEDLELGLLDMDAATGEETTPAAAEAMAPGGSR